MSKLSRLLALVGETAGRQPVRRATLDVEELEARVVPSLLGQQLFPSDYPWNQDISNAPVAANSAAVITQIGSSIKIHPDWGQDSPSNGSSPLYGIPFNVVHGNTTAKVNVIIDNYPGESDVVPVPIPANAVIEGDFQNGPNPNGGGGLPGQRGDSHLIVWDEDTNIAYELFGATRPADLTLFPNTNGVELPHTDGQWHAAQESVWNMNTRNFRTLGDTSADAAGLSVLAGLARPDEGLPSEQGGQGAINHALRFTLPSGDVNPQYIYPASHVVNTSSGSAKLPLGARLRLQSTPAVNAQINTLGPQAQIIARAMQHFGLVLADLGSAMFVSGSSASQDANNNINFTWNMTDVLGLSALTAGNFDVVNLTPRVTGLSASSGPAGSTITVIGQNFSGAAGHLQVFFGSAAASSVTFVDDAHITAVVPNGSGTVQVQVQSGINATDPNNPNDNVNNPIFGYGISALSTADQFTYGSGGGGGGGGFPLPARVFVTAADAGGGPDVKVFAADGTFLAGFFAFDARFTGGVRVAVGDVNGDGFPDVICAAGPGGGPNVVVFSGKDRSEIYNFFAFDINFTGGTFVAAGDVNGDGFADIIVGADAGGGPNVFVLSGKDRSPLLSYFPYDIHFTGGVRVAAGDVNGDGRADIVTGAGTGGGPNVTVYQLINGQPQVLQSYFAFDLHFSAGIFVGAGDVNGDGRADVIAGSGPISMADAQFVNKPTAAVFNGVDASALARYPAFPMDPSFSGAVRVAATKLTGSGKASVITMHGPGGTPDVDILDGLTGQLLDRFFAYDPAFSGGAFLANTVP